MSSTSDLYASQALRGFLLTRQWQDRRVVATPGQNMGREAAATVPAPDPVDIDRGWPGKGGD